MMRWLESLYWAVRLPRLTLRNALDRWHERLRRKAPEPRLWIWSWQDGGNFWRDGRHYWLPDRYFWREVTCPNEADRILCVVGMAASRSEAQRLIKQSGPRYRSWYPDTWTRIPRFDFRFPGGCPVELQRSGDTYLTKTVLIPNASCQLRYWNRVGLDL